MTVSDFSKINETLFNEPDVSEVNEKLCFNTELLQQCRAQTHLKVKFEGINVLESNEIRQGVKDYADWPTIPQLYIKGEFVGGCDIVKEMFEKGELKKLLENKSLLS